MSADRVAPVKLHHVEQVPTFIVEGHLYESDDGRRFYVFTAGDGSVWSATEPEANRSLGNYLVRLASSKNDCLAQLARVLEHQDT
jgi:hypothetical protein